MFRKIEEERKREILYKYLKGKISLRKLSREENVCWTTIWRWKKYGFKNISNEIEEKIIYIKEKKPEISLSEISHLIYKQTGRKISIGKIYNVINKKTLKGKTIFLPNDYPVFKNKLEYYLNLNFYNVENHLFHLHEIRKIRRYFEKEKLVYSSMQTLLREMILLEWLSRPAEIIKVSENYKLNFLKIKNSELKLNFFISRAIAYTVLLQIKKAKEELKIIKKILKNKINKFPVSLAFLYTFMELNNDKVFQLFVKKSIKKEKLNYEFIPLSSFYIMRGKYKEALEVTKRTEKRNIAVEVIKAYCYFFLGEIGKVREILKNAHQLLKKGEVGEYFFDVYFIDTMIDMLYNKKNKVKKDLEEILNYTKKFNNIRKIVIPYILLNKKIPYKKIEPLQSHKILLMLRELSRGKKNYKSLLRFVQKNNMWGFLHKYLLFYPEVAFDLIGKYKIYFPKKLLEFPLFNSNSVPIFIKFLGPFIVYVKNKKIKAKLSLKEKALLIFLAYKIPLPGYKTKVENLIKNFFYKSKNPSHIISHYLNSIRKKLNLPSFLITIKDLNEKMLINRGIYFLTDFDEYEDIYKRSRILAIEEWELSKKEFKKALRIFRGKPFEKMYDNFSDFQRILILNTFEDNIKIFINEAIKRKDFKFKKFLEEKLKRILF